MTQRSTAIRPLRSNFCKVYEKAVLLTPSPENVRTWVEYTRMTPDEMEDAIQESYELAETFKTIGDIIKIEIMPNDWRNAKSA